MKSIRQLARENDIKPEMVFDRLKKGWSLEDALQPKGYNRPIDIQNKISKLDPEIVYLGGYKNKNSRIKLHCNRCGTTYERVYARLVQKKYNNKLCCEKCQRQTINWTNQYGKLEDREKRFIDIFNSLYPTLEYISGYIDSDKPVLVRCKICGKEFKRNADCIRAGRKTSCLNCLLIKKKEKAAIRKKQKEIEHTKDKMISMYNREINKQIKLVNKYLISNTIYIKKCNCCGEEFAAKKKIKIFCNVCISKLHKHHSTKSLRELYKRDKGICYICNKPCDYNDYIVKNNNIICGNNYPSIEHVIPISKGGTDEWDNIKLAHRHCNSIKGNKLEA
ncbi:MAG: HNH endonuclease [Bacilli bacterium]|nr:HNH endonuclease [Bacilli bacterium]